MTPQRFLKAGAAAAFLGLAASPANAIERTFPPSDEVFINPERGFYFPVQFRNVPSLGAIPAQGISLIYADIYLPEYRDGPIAQDRLDNIVASFDRTRQAGLKAIVRITYNHAIGDDDAPLSVVETHLEQLAPIFEAHADVIYGFQAGIIGSWGEWHSSSNGLTSEPNRRAVIELLLQHTPPGKFIALRTPPFKWDYTGGTALLPQQAFTGVPIARLAHHNDCFLASSTDVGTYPGDSVELWKSRLGFDTQFVPIGGETCRVSEFGTCGFGIPEMERLHWSYLNIAYNQDVLDDMAPCRLEFERRLGYRFRLVSASLPDQLVTGREATVRLVFANDGFAPIYNPRPVVLRLLRSDDVVMEIPLTTADPRRWLPGEGLTYTVQETFTVPPEIIPGDVDLAIRMPDPSGALEGDARYAIRLANPDLWDAAGGQNVFLRGVPLQAVQPGSTWAVR
ncbi:MAG: DUF4832 domain-containing protein [Sumerlaeia bacterium]